MRRLTGGRDNAGGVTIGRLRPRTCGFAWLLPLAIICAVPVRLYGAELLPAPSSSSPLTTTLPRDEPIIVEVILNQVKRGAFPLIITAAGDCLLRGEDLLAMGVAVSDEARLEVAGELYYALRMLGATALRLDEMSLTLSADLPAERWPKQGLDFQPRQAAVRIPRYNSAFLNYRLLNSGDSAGNDSWLVGSELGIRYHELLFRNDTARVHTPDAIQTLRYSSSITHDDRTTLQRTIAGDFVVSSGNLGNTLALGGLSFSKAYALDPYFVRQPTAGFVSTVTAPAQAELYLDGTRLRTTTLQPGEFELKNFNYYGGQHDLQLVIRDSFGREERIAYPYYFSEQNLRQGLHDYGYNAGRIRRDAATSQDRYEEWALSAYHRYGWSDELTLGARGEATAGVFNVGPTAVARHNRWGVFSGALAVSGGAQGNGWAGAFGYGYQERSFNLQGMLRNYSPTYERVGRAASDERPSLEIVAGVGYGIKQFGTLGISGRRHDYYQGSDQRVTSLTYSRALDRSWHLTAGVGRSSSSGEESRFAHLTLNYHPGRTYNATLTHHQGDGEHGETLQLGNTTPAGEGLGYRVVAEHSVAESGERARFAPWAQYNGRYASYSATLQHVAQQGDESVTGYQLGVSGGIGYVAGRTGFSRPISDSFALVEVGGLEGVRVYQNGQPMGGTDTQGRLLLPHLGSYLTNRVSVDDRDIPIDYTLVAREQELSPQLRSGTLVSFAVSQLQAVVGRLLVKHDGVWQPAPYGNLTITTQDGTRSMPLGRDGEFYIEDLKAGRYRVWYDQAGERCEFELNIPVVDETLNDLGELHGCEVAR